MSPANTNHQSEPEPLVGLEDLFSEHTIELSPGAYEQFLALISSKREIPELAKREAREYLEKFGPLHLRAPSERG